MIQLYCPKCTKNMRNLGEWPMHVPAPGDGEHTFNLVQVNKWVCDCRLPHPEIRTGTQVCVCIPMDQLKGMAV